VDLLGAPYQTQDNFSTQFSFDGFSYEVVAAVADDPPIADAGVDQKVTALTTVTLDGRGSSDPDGVSLKYAWSFISRPTGSAATLAGPATQRPSFVADRVGAYRIKLTVSDGALEDEDTVTVTARSPFD